MTGRRTVGKRVASATAAVFVVWAALDFVIHGVILRDLYAATANLWRPMAEMKMGVMYVAVLAAAFVFVFIYARLVAEKSVARGTFFGTLWGVGVGVGMGYGSYAVMPIPYFMALTWFLGTVVEGFAAGLVAGLIVRDRAAGFSTRPG